MFMFPESFAFLLVLIFTAKISATGISLIISKYKRVKYLDDKVSFDQEFLFSPKHSLVECVLQCVDAKSCVSVFYSPLLCKGYSTAFSQSSASLIQMPGTRYFVHDQSPPTNAGTSTQGSLQNNLTDVATVSSMLGSCSSLNPLGYTWDFVYGICYHLHVSKLNVLNAKAKCQTEHGNSRLLLVDSDDTYNFAVKIIDTYHTGPIYLQGTRSGGSNFVDDNGQLMTYFKWDVGEPDSSGDYLRSDTDTRLQETSSGSSSFKFICRLY
ncbi:uncharacterized protein LOC133196614 [Saccostrea echinata]|uniref:uncharacterized protein LOC133196614 n=1 Tax=Saccostrea echinata TaxID=191078 RepID=UPI002A810692|nr:uncharacterized protein LOC133196614 [Saccostrea echinata]